MNQGHLRSILPQRGGVSPVDNNTVALFHYDEHAKDSIRGIAPLGERDALGFGNVATDYVSLGNPQLSELTNCTVEFWCKTSKTTPWLLLVGQSTGYYLMARNTSTFYHRLAGNPTIYIDGIVGNTLKYDGQWHHYAAVGVDLSAWTSLNLGGYNTQFTLHDQISSLRIWNKPLSVSEIRKAADGNASVDGLHSYWKLNEKEGSLAYDYSSLGNDGVINNCFWSEGRSIHSFAEDSLRGGVILVEEPTINLIDPSGYVGDSNFSVEKINEFTLKVTLLNDMSATTNGYHIQQVVSSAIPAGSPATMSIEVLERSNPAWKIGIGGWGSIDSATGTHLIIGNREIKTITHTSDWSYSISLGYINSSNKTLLVPGDYIVVRYAQIEQKAYATSFTDGARSAGRLVHSLPPTTPPLTCSFWFKRNAGTHTSQLINLLDATKEWRIWLDWGTDMSFSVAHITDTTTTSYGRVDGGTITSDWTFIALVITTTELILYQDGDIVGSSVHGGTFPAFSEITVGCHIDSAQPPINGLFDELRIDKVTRTQAEIHAWYYQGRNGW